MKLKGQGRLEQVERRQAQSHHELAEWWRTNLKLIGREISNFKFQINFK